MDAARRAPRLTTRIATTLLLAAGMVAVSLTMALPASAATIGEQLT
jgi:hypothetical protein